MRRALPALVLLTACEQPRTEIMIGVVTDIRAPGLIDGARLIVTRAKDGFPEQDVAWELSGLPNQPFNLPGSYGVYSDGEEVKLDLVLTGLKGPTPVLNRRAVLNLVEGKTLFFRMSLVAGCQDRTDCLATQTCVEGVCRDVNVDSDQLPDFEPTLVDHLTCDSGTAFIDTSTGAALPLAEGAEDCPANLCLDGTCLKPPPTPSSGSRAVTGYQYTTYIEASKTTNVPEDLTMAGIAALVPQTNGSFTVIQGRGNADGSFVIDNVPNGTYYLRVGNKYFVTDADSFDLTAAIGGRPNLVPAATGTGINLMSVTNMNPWSADDHLEVVAPGADTWWFELQGTYPITLGATSLTNYSFLSQDAAGNSTPSLVANDPVGITQLQAKTEPQTQLVYSAQTKFAQLPPFTQGNGTTAQVAAFPFVDVPQTAMTDAPFRGTVWDEALGYDGTNLTRLNPEAAHFVATDGYGVFVHAQLGGALYGQYGATQDFMYAIIPHGQDVPLTGLTFGTMTLPGLWATLVSADVIARVQYFYPGTSTPAVTNVGMRQTALLSTVTPDFYLPRFGPVRAPLIDGRDLFQSQMVVTTPTISWQPPAIGKPTTYEIRIFELTANGTSTVKTEVAIITTTANTVVVPPGVLVLNHYYGVTIAAETTPNPSAPNRRRLPDAYCSVASAMFVPTMTGGTTVDPGPMAGDGGVTTTPLDAPGPLAEPDAGCTPTGIEACGNCVDDDSDGFIDLADPQCTDPQDTSESI